MSMSVVFINHPPPHTHAHTHTVYILAQRVPLCLELMIWLCWLTGLWIPSKCWGSRGMSPTTQSSCGAGDPDSNKHLTNHSHLPSSQGRSLTLLFNPSMTAKMGIPSQMHRSLRGDSACWKRVETQPFDFKQMSSFLLSLHRSAQKCIAQRATSRESTASGPLQYEGKWEKNRGAWVVRASLHSLTHPTSCPFDLLRTICNLVKTGGVLSGLTCNRYSPKPVF